jgi:tetratricopeptide (TPR) repeat protein
MTATQKPKPACTPSDAERALSPGVFIPATDMPAFVRRMCELQRRMDAMLRHGHARAVVVLYELLLAGLVVKRSDCTDPKSLFPGVFRSLFCGWIRARQKAGMPAKETVRQAMQWVTDPPCPECAVPVDVVATALDHWGYGLLAERYRQLLEVSLDVWKGVSPNPEVPRPAHVLQSASELGAIYFARGDTEAYAVLCQLVGLTVSDCCNLARMADRKHNAELALKWIERGLELAGDTLAESTHAGILKDRQLALLIKLGRKDEARAVAWRIFRTAPSVAAYERVMKLVPDADRAVWQRRAMLFATHLTAASLDVLVHGDDWNMLARRIGRAAEATIGQFGLRLADGAWQSLTKADAGAAAKLHVAVAFRILGQERGVDHTVALCHLQKARDLYRKGGDRASWDAVVTRIAQMSRDPQNTKARFERIAAWAPDDGTVPFLEEAKGLWSAIMEEPDLFIERRQVNE